MVIQTGKSKIIVNLLLIDCLPVSLLIFFIICKVEYVLMAMYQNINNITLPVDKKIIADTRVTIVGINFFVLFIKEIIINKSIIISSGRVI